MPASQPANFNLQEFTDVGKPLVGGRIYTYAYGTTQQQIAYTDPDGLVPHTYTADGAGGQYIALNARGELPAPLYLGAGSYDISLKRADGSTVWTRKADGVDGSLRSWMALLTASLGASLVGFAQADANAVARTVLDDLRDRPVSISAFGALGKGNDRAIVQAAVNFCKNGKVLDLGSNVLDLGIVAPGAPAITIDSPVNMKIIGNGALVKCIATLDRCVAIAVKNPINFISDGVEFTNPGFDISQTQSGVNRIGIYGYYPYATAPYTAASPCGPVSITGAAHDCLGFVVVDSTTQLGVHGAVPFAMKNVKVRGHCERVYYGVSSIYGATDVDVEMSHQDVRRGFISYGQQRAKIDLSLNCSAGFLGSNAYVELACEGQANGNVRDIDIRVRVDGVEAHENIVNFYHQQAGAAGSIGNVKARVTFNYLTTAGKAAGLNSLAAFCFLHEDPVTANPISPTARLTENCDIDCDVLGAISGPRVRLSSSPSTKVPITLGRGVTEGMTDFGMFQLWKVRRGSLTLPFTPYAYGRTTLGAANYNMQKGTMSIVDGVASCSISLNWTAHTGTGNLMVTPLPVQGISSATIGNPAAAVISSGFGPAGGQIGALLTDQMDTFTIYSVDSTTHAISIPAVPAAGNLYLSCSFPLYT
jgi:hypothetical protein